MQADADSLKVLGEGFLVPPFGAVNALYVPEASANLLADVDVKNHFRIERVFNLESDSYALTSLSSGITHVFACNSNGVFVWHEGSGKKNVFNAYYQALGISKAVIEKMLLVHKLHEGMGYMAREKMVGILQSLNNSLISATDVRLYFEHMHARACKACRGGKITTPVQVSIPDQLVTHAIGELVHMDIVFPTEKNINDTEGKGKKKKKQIAILQCIDDYSGFTMGSQVDSRSAVSITLAIEKLIASYTNW